MIPISIYPGNTSVQILLSLPVDSSFENGLLINVANTTASAVQYNLFMDSNGSTCDQSTALAYGVTIDAFAVQQYELKMKIEGDGGGIFCQVGTAPSCTFTVGDLT